MEVLEGRQLLSTFAVTNLHNSGPGSLRQAIVASNRHAGADSIHFEVAGTIKTRGQSLPAITDPVTIDGSTAPSFAGTPVVTLDFRGLNGLKFAKGAEGSTLGSLSLIRAGNSAVTLSASHVTVSGNFIGLRPDGRTVAGNRGDGVRINPSSHGNVVGRSDSVTSVTFYNADSINLYNPETMTNQSVSGWQGIRDGDTPGEYLLAGTSESNGLLYVGPIDGSGGTSYAVNFPGAKSTSVYGPNNLGGGRVQLVGSFKDGNDVVNGFFYEGSTADLAQGTGTYRQINYPNAKFNYVHSTMGGLAVGNADGPEGNLPIGTGHAFLYDVARGTFLPDIVYPGSLTTSAYGIWHNGGTSYTIVGGYSSFLEPGREIGRGFLVDYDSATGRYMNWTSLNYPNGVVGQDYITHFEGISSREPGVYTLAADSVQRGTADPVQGSWVTVKRGTDGSFGAGVWVNLNYPGMDPSTTWTTNDSVAGNQAVGIVVSKSGVFSFEATVNVAARRPNVISGNGGHGIGIYGRNDSKVARNLIGLDFRGHRLRVNAKKAILVVNSTKRHDIEG